MTMDERLRLLNQVIELNKAEMNLINKTASERRMPMNVHDKGRLYVLRNVNLALCRAKYNIITDLPNKITYDEKD